MKWINQALAGIVLAACGINAASAIPLLSVVPTVASVVEGSSTSVDVVVSGLDDELIGDYDLTLVWDSTLLSLSNVTFDSFLDGPVDSISGFGTGPGSLSIFEVSLGGLTNQLGLSQFRLFTMDLLTLNDGLASVSFTGSEILGNEFGEAYGAWGVENGGLEITARQQPPTSVPEPATLGLLVSGLAGMLFARRHAGPARQRQC